MGGLFVCRTQAIVQDKPMIRSCTYRLILPLALLALPLASAQAKPLITNSETTFESLCLDYGDTPERLIEICQRGLNSDEASQADRLKMMDALAWAHGQVGDVEQARQVYEAMRATAPNDPDALLGLGWLAHEADEYAVAAEFFQGAMEVRPEEEALAGLASSLIRSDQMTLEEGLPMLEAALAIDPDYGWALREKGWLLVRDDRQEAAKASFQAALDVDPEDGYAHYGMAYVLSDLDDWQPALESVNRALQSVPDFGSAVSRRALILLYLDRPAQALRDADRVIEMWPDSSDGFVLKARAQTDLGWGRKGLETLESAEAATGYDPYLYYWRAKLQEQGDQPDAALATLAEVFRRGDEDYFDHTLRTSLLIDTKDYVGARAAVNSALDSYPGEAWLLFYESIVLVHEEAYEQAERQFDAAVDAGLPHSRLAYFLKQLSGAARYVQAVQMRVRYADLAQEANSN